MFLHVNSEISKCAPDPAFFVYLDIDRLFASAEPDFALKVQVQGGEYTGIDIAVDRALAHHDLIPVRGTDMVGRLFFPDERGDQFIQAPHFFFRKRDAAPAFREKAVITAVSRPCIIETFFQGAFDAVRAAVADIRRLGKCRAFFFAEIAAERIAHRTPAAEFMPVVGMTGIADT
jgi:hypothetical protein